MIDQFAVKLPVDNQAEIPRRSSAGMHLYIAVLGSGAPLEFPSGTSLRTVDANGNDIYLKPVHIFGTPWAVRKEADGMVKELLEQLVAPAETGSKPVDLGW